MKRTLITIFLTLTLFIFVPLALAHPGRTDSKGCHTCWTNCEKWGLSYGEYHCHKGGSSSSGGSSTTPAYSPPPAPLTISIYVNGTKLYCDQEPTMSNNRVLVPLRAIMEALGATVEWDPATETVNANKADFNFSHPVGQWYAFANGKQINLDVPSENENGRILVPVRVISESLGANVSWDDTNRTVYVTY